MGKNATLEYYLENFPRAIELSAREQETLEEINRRVAAGRDLKEILVFVFERLGEISHCDRLALAFVEEGEDRITAHWAKANYENVYLNKGYAENLYGSSLARVLEKGEPRIINDLEAYMESHPESISTKLVLREGLRSSMTCPLSVDGRRVGLLFKSSCKKNAYDARELAIHTTVAERISQAVEKAYIIEKLDEAKNSYTEMLGFVSHELKSPLASITMDITAMLDGLYGEIPEKVGQKIGKMKQRAEYLIGLVRDYLDLARIESGELEANISAEVSFIDDVATPALEIVQPNLNEAKCPVNMVCEPDAPHRAITADPDLLKIVLVNYLNNAAKYGEEKGEIILNILQKPELLRVSVKNHGPGFSKEMKNSLFRKFSRLQKPELLKKKGTGVGLYSCRRIVALHGGRVWAESEEGRWAEFFFEIPLKKAQE